MNEQTHQPPATDEQIVVQIRHGACKSDGYYWAITDQEAVQLLNDWLSAHVAQATEGLRLKAADRNEWQQAAMKARSDADSLSTICAKQKEALQVANKSLADFATSGMRMNGETWCDTQQTISSALHITSATVADELAAKDKRITELENSLALEHNAYLDELSKAEANGLAAESAEAKVAEQADEIARLRETITAIRAVNVNEFGHVADVAIERLIETHDALKADAKGNE